jgi:copper(I)-binding protein
MRNRLLPFAIVIAAFTAAPVIAVMSAHAADTGLTVQQPWARPGAEGQVGVVYLTVIDTGAPDRLVGARSPVATDVQLHESTKEGTVMKMRPIEGAAVAPGQPLVLKPGSYHIMLMGLKQTLKEGDTVPVTLLFEKAGAVETQATVRREPPPQ